MTSCQGGWTDKKAVYPTLTSYYFYLCCEPFLRNKETGLLYVCEWGGERAENEK